MAEEFGVCELTAPASAPDEPLLDEAQPMRTGDPAPLRLDAVPRSPLATAIDCLARGEAARALTAAGEACSAEPSRPEAHYVHGQAWMALNEPARAERAFEAAIQLRPGWADAWVNYGLARYAQGATEHAKGAMRQALAVEPGHKGATANLGAFLRITGHHEEAEALLRDALRRDPSNAAVRLNLAAEMLGEERPGDALELLDEMPAPAEPGAARHWHLQRALALVGTGRPRDARNALDAFDAFGPAPPALAPLRQWRLVLLALADGHPSSAQAEACIFEDMLGTAGTALVSEHRIMAHYDLAKFWSRFDAPRRAFAHWTAGHRLLKAVQPFSREAEAAFEEAAAATFTAERLARGPRASNDDPAPVFIVGMPRSGTTLTEQIIAAHAGAHGAGERPALGRLFHHLAGNDTPEGVARIDALSCEALDAAAANYLADLHALAPGASRIIDKMPGNYRYVWLIALLFPRARIIHCTRDPRDIGLSIFTFRFHGQHGYAHDLADLGWAIARQDRSMAHWKALPNSVLTVRLADWVEDFDGTLARVLDHLGLPPDPGCARFHEAEDRVRTVSRGQVRQPVNGRGLGRWRAYVEQLAPLIDELERGGALEAWRERPSNGHEPGCLAPPAG